MLEYMIFSSLENFAEANDMIFVYAIAPIVSVTLIVIFLLLGAFRGFRERDMESLPIETAGRAMTGNGP